ncbi:DUF4232 domain-containing protein [Streptomyces sp. NPDC005900]|uniref:DUF4232 domain-containing protein n=1 Tax=unclassified Streptomyces TaxID=2593676 RepID=UPI00340D8029
MKLTHLSKSLLACLTLAGALALTACDNDGTADAVGAPSGSKPTASAESGRDGGGGSGSGGGSSSSSSEGGETSPDDSTGTDSTENKKTGICRSDELEVTAIDNSTDKTEGIVTVAFKNGGGRDCSISGYAGVDLETAAGDTLSVDRNGEQTHAEILKDGETAAFNITFPANTSGGSGVRITKILVTPPNETKTVTVDWPAGSLPVAGEGSSNGPKLAIGPVGKVSDSPAG